MASGDPGTPKRYYSATAVETTLSGSIGSSTTDGATSGVVVASVSGFPSSYPYTLILDPDTSSEEVVQVTSAAGTTLVLKRGQDSTTAPAHSAGAVVRHGVSAREFKDLQVHISARGYDDDSAYLSGIDTHVHGIATGQGAVVGTDKNQTLTNKKLSDSTTTIIDVSDVSKVIKFDVGGTTAVTGTIATAFTTAKTLTLPDATDTLVGKATTDTLTNKTFDTAGTGNVLKINGTTISNVSGSGAAVLVVSPTITGTALATNLTASGTVTATAFAGPLTGNVTGDVTGNVSGSSGSTTGNAATATALATGRTISLTGDVVGTTGSFDGTAAATMVAAIGTGVIVDADINASAAVAYSKLNLNGTITSADIVNGTIVAGDIATGTITATQMATDPYARANHTGTQLAATVSDFDTQVRTSRLDQMAAPTASVALNAQKITGLGTPTANTTDAATTAYVDTAVANLVNSAPGTLDTLGEIATAIQAGGTVFDAMVLKAGSTMTGALTLSGAPTVGLHAATKTYVDTVAGSATAAAASAAAAAASYDSFDDRYLGPYATAPTLDNDGNALITGAIYWNTVTNVMYAWTGSVWGSISSSAAIYRYRFTATGGETSKSGADDLSQTLAYTAGNEQVYLNGVLLVRTTDYTATNGTSITALAALTASDVLEVITFTPFSVITDIPQSVVDAKGDLVVGTAADTVGRLGVGTNGQYLQADSTAGTGLVWSTVTGYSAPTIGSTVVNSGATVTTIAGLTLTAPTLTGTVTASGDITLSAAGAFGSIIDFQTLSLMGAL